MRVSYRNVSEKWTASCAHRNTSTCNLQYIVDCNYAILETVDRSASLRERGGLLLLLSLWRGAHFHLALRSRCGAVLTFFRDSRDTRATLSWSLCQKSRARARLFWTIVLKSSEASHASSTFQLLLPEASCESSTFSGQRRKLRAVVTSGRFRGSPGCRARKIDFLERRLI